MDKYYSYIPLDKSWLVRVGVLDILNSYNDIATFLDTQTNLNEDLLALKQASVVWNTNKPIHVGESATLYRFLQFASWKFNLDKTFIKEGTLNERGVTNDPSIINLSLVELLKLDNGTTQWASASVIADINTPRNNNYPYKLLETFDAVEHWKRRRQAGLSWEPKRDVTIERQVKKFLELLEGQNTVFVPLCSDDYCFARVFDFIDSKDGAKMWPSLVGHETNRILEMEQAINEANDVQVVSSKDHRVIQALAMWGLLHKKQLHFKYPNAVNKSWPLFWEFLDTFFA